MFHLSLDKADEDAVVPPMDVIVDIAPWQFPMWALESLRDLWIEGVPPRLADIGEGLNDLIGSYNSNGSSSGLGLLAFLSSIKR